MKITGSPDRPKEVCPEGTYPGRVFFLCDLGTHTDTFAGQTKTRRKARIVVELTGATMEDGRPFALGKDFNMSLGFAPKPGKPAKGLTNPLLTLIKAITGKDCPTNKNGDYEFDLERLMGGVALFSVSHNDGGKAKIQSFMALPKGMAVDEPANEPFVLSLAPDEFSEEAFFGLSPYWQKTIQDSPEGKALSLHEFDEESLNSQRERIKEKKKEAKDDDGLPPF